VSRRIISRAARRCYVLLPPIRDDFFPLLNSSRAMRRGYSGFCGNVVGVACRSDDFYKALFFHPPVTSFFLRFSPCSLRQNAPSCLSKAVVETECREAFSPVIDVGPPFSLFSLRHLCYDALVGDTTWTSYIFPLSFRHCSYRSNFDDPSFSLLRHSPLCLVPTSMTGATYPAQFGHPIYRLSS